MYHSRNLSISTAWVLNAGRPKYLTSECPVLYCDDDNTNLGIAAMTENHEAFLGVCTPLNPVIIEMLPLPSLLFTPPVPLCPHQGARSPAQALPPVPDTTVLLSRHCSVRPNQTQALQSATYPTDPHLTGRCSENVLPALSPLCSSHRKGTSVNQELRGRSMDQATKDSGHCGISSLRPAECAPRCPWGWAGSCCLRDL